MHLRILRGQTLRNAMFLKSVAAQTQGEHTRNCNDWFGNGWTSFA
jgi:hypothetical protein